MQDFNSAEFKQQELNNCNFVKTILMLIVVLYHSILFWGGGSWFSAEPLDKASFFGPVASWFNTFHIYAFTLVSGYLFAYLKYEKNKYKQFVPFAVNKVKRLIVPYIFVALCWVIPIATYFFNYSFMDIVDRYVLGTAPSQLWFLLMLFNVFLIFWLLADFFEKYDFWGMVVVCLFYCLSIVGNKLIPNYYRIWSAFSFSPLFFLGLKIRQKGLSFIYKIPALVWLIVDIAVFVLFKYVLVGEGIIFSLLSIGGTFVVTVLGGLTAFVVLQKLANVFKGWQTSKFFSLLTEYSMPTFLFHQQVIYFFLHFFNGVISPYLLFLINFVGSVLISMLISFILKKFKVTRFLIGEKA